VKIKAIGVLLVGAVLISCVHQVDEVRRAENVTPSQRPAKKSVSAKRLVVKSWQRRVCWLPLRDDRREIRGYHKISTIRVLNTGQQLQGTWRRIDERTVTIVLYGVSGRERYDIAISRRGRGYHVMPLISRRNVGKYQQVLLLRYVRDRHRHAVVAMRKEG